LSELNRLLKNSPKVVLKGRSFKGCYETLPLKKVGGTECSRLAIKPAAKRRDEVRPGRETRVEWEKDASRFSGDTVS